ncbi:MAG: hypothetical protein Q9218_006120 [Villophora microphyllina]
MDSSTSTMADQLSVSLRAWPSDDKTTETLPFLISRINEQRGSFRNITEASLQEEIRNIDTNDSKVVDDSGFEEGVDDGHKTKSRGKELATAREEIIRQAGEAYNMSFQALDLVSLLLSSHALKAAEATVSPFTKAAVPFGSLGAEIMQQPQKSEEEKATEGLVNLGWRMQSLTSSANALLQSASSLEQEIGRETAYWQEILAVKANGWSVCRLPSERHTLGVRFGFIEAHTEFRDRGLAALRRGIGGNIELDRGPRWQRDQRLRVRLLKGGIPAATSQISEAATEDDPPLTQQLMRARNSLFDEELYHELNREAQNLVNQGVRCIGGAVRLPYRDDTEIEIDFVPEDEDDEAASNEATVPSTVLMALRILLSHAHHQNHQRRSQPPPPISDSTPPRPFYSLLRPILEFSQHNSTSQKVKDRVDNFKRITSAAALSFTFDENISSSSLSSVPTHPSQSQSQPPSLEALIDQLTSPRHTQIIFHLPSNHTTLTLDIRTSILPPILGTSFQLSIASSVPDSGIAQMPHSLHFQTVDKLWKHILHITGLDTVALFERSKGVPSWLVPKSPYEAEMLGKNPETGRKHRLVIRLGTQELRADWTDGERTGVHVWTGSEDREKEQGREKGLVEVVMEELR